MYLIDETYFEGQYFVPNAQETNTGALAKLNRIIDKYARLYLKNALGYTLFNDFDSNVTDGVLDGGAPSKWSDLVNGKEYTNGGFTYKWNGLLLTEGTSKQSPIVPYVYYHWLLDEQQKQVGVGTVTINAKNSTNVNATQTLVNAWNEFVTLYQYDCDNHKYLYESWLFDYDYWWTNDSTNFVSLVKFLEDNEDTYSEPALKLFELKNSFGL